MATPGLPASSGPMRRSAATTSASLYELFVADRNSARSRSVISAIQDVFHVEPLAHGELRVLREQ
eukprot:8027095-Lingulodinium_polyedra.AAC.1